MLGGKLDYLNLGCGVKYHPDWVNVDIVASDESIIECNFLNGIPFPDNSFEVVYHSHVLEHFPKRLGEIDDKGNYSN